MKSGSSWIHTLIFTECVLEHTTQEQNDYVSKTVWTLFLWVASTSAQIIEFENKKLPAECSVRTDQRLYWLKRKLWRYMNHCTSSEYNWQLCVSSGMSIDRQCIGSIPPSLESGIAFVIGYQCMHFACTWCGINQVVLEMWIINELRQTNDKLFYISNSKGNTLKWIFKTNYTPQSHFSCC